MNGNDIKTFHQEMPAMKRHKGSWQGRYQHLDLNGQLIDQHQSTVRCEFPSSGEFAYIQYNHFVWEDGRDHKAILPEIYKDKRLWWDTETFHGYAWQSDNDIILLNLTRKDEPGAYFIEIIIIGDDDQHRSRTWHWFKDGRLYKRTLCEEMRISGD